MAAKNQRWSFDILIPVIVAGIFAALNLLPVYRGAERRLRRPKQGRSTVGVRSAREAETRL